MNEMNERSDRLDTIFDQAREHLAEPPLLERAELLAHLGAATITPAVGDASDDPTSKRKPRYILTGIIMTTIIGTVLVMMSIIGADNTKTDDTQAILPSTTMQESLVATEMNDATGTDDAESTGQHGSNPFDIASVTTIQRGTRTSGKREGEADEDFVAPAPLIDLNDLTSQELEEIFGVTYAESEIWIENIAEISLASLSDRDKQRMREDGYRLDEPVLYFASKTIIDRYEFGVRSTTPTQVDQAPILGRIRLSGRSGGQRVSSANSLPIVMREAGWDDSWVHYPFTRPDWPEAWSSIPYLIRLELPIATQDDLEEYVLWYVPTPDLVARLPERYRTELLQKLPAIMESGRIQSVTFDAMRDDTEARDPDLFAGTETYHQFGPSELGANTETLEGIAYIDLTAGEGGRIGITTTDEGMTAVMKSHVSSGRFSDGLAHHGYDANDDAPVVGFSVTLTGNIEDQDGPKTLAAGSFDATMPAPVLFTTQTRDPETNRGASRLFLADDPPVDLADLEAMPNLRDALEALSKSVNRPAETATKANTAIASVIDRLVPVRMRLDNNATAIFWYLPTPALLERLPSRYSDAIAGEIAAAEGTASSCERTPGEPTYLGLCRRTSGAIGGIAMRPHPVPAGTTPTIMLHLDEPRELTIALHNIGGTHVTDLVASKRYAAGDHAITVDAASLSQGAWIITATSNEGEQVVRRVVVR